MKLYVILRGFPGLGRVVAGLALMEQLRFKGWECRIATYGRGLAAIKEGNYNRFISFDDEINEGVSSIGIIPVSRFGEAIISDIYNWNPDLILCDGEPLMLETMSIIGLSNRTITLANQFDLFNHNNQYSSQKFFSYMYNKAGMILLHGLAINRDKETAKCKIMNTIIRPEIINLGNLYKKCDSCKSNRIVGIIGGGMYKANKEFKESSVKIAKLFIRLAKYNKDKKFFLYCNGISYGDNSKLDEDIPNNISIILEYSSPSEMYNNAELVIARAGRNTISELIFLKKKAIVIPTVKHDFRGGEQKENIINAEIITNGNIVGFESYNDINALDVLFKELLNKQTHEYDWVPGNDIAVNEILKFKNERI